jgi:hypothetical protein
MDAALVEGLLAHRAAHHRKDGREPRAAGDAQEVARAVLAQVSQSVRPVQLERRADGQREERRRPDATGHAFHHEMPFPVPSSTFDIE